MMTALERADAVGLAAVNEAVRQSPQDRHAMVYLRAAIQSLIDGMPEDAVNAIGRHDADRRAIITAALRKVIE